MKDRDEGERPDARASAIPAMTTPFWDGVLTGGLSILGMGIILLYTAGSGVAPRFVEGDYIALALLINSPHFMASYPVLYGSPGSLRRHPWATLVVPAILLGVLAAVILSERPAPLMNGLVLVSSIYLAWHYAGQTWGMVMTFSHLAGVRYEPRERTLIRFGPRALIAIHVLFALSGRLPPRDWVDPATYMAAYTWAFGGVCALIVVSFGAGLYAFRRARQRGEPVPLRAIAPWMALYLWYPFWYFVPGGFMWVQLSHALQYLAFPIRVEVNRYSDRRTARGEIVAERKKKVRAGLAYVGFVAMGMVVLHGPPLVTHALGEGWWSTPDIRRALAALTLCVGIHHYFVDGAIWHLRNESVRRELFSHVAR